MAFKLGDLIVDRVLQGYFENNGELQFTLNNVSTASINVTSESNDVTDSQGNLVHRFYTGKTGEFTATNAFLNLNILGAQTGAGKQQASNSAPIQMPKAFTIKAGATPTLANLVEGSVIVKALSNGEIDEDKTFTLGVGSASATEFTIDSSNVLTLPTDPDVTSYLVKYVRNVTSGVKIRNTTTDFPNAGKLTLKVVAKDPCAKDFVRIMYVEMPNFQVSPDVSISIDRSNQNIDFTGAVLVDWCSDDKELYSIYVAEDDINENE